jgi:hypothetical protein
MTPTHSDAIAAAKRVHAAYSAAARGNGPQLCDPADAMLMHLYQLSLELRRLPERERMNRALGICRQLIANTRESLD